ncbi:MAG: hypothetical protein O2816_11220 [Planctomycetota bacterium]|nr:hypothetical protein [Planctomycetota bacterium]
MSLEHYLFAGQVHPRQLGKSAARQRAQGRRANRQDRVRDEQGDRIDALEDDLG